MLEKKTDMQHIKNYRSFLRQRNVLDSLRAYLEVTEEFLLGLEEIGVLDPEGRMDIQVNFNVTVIRIILRIIFSFSES